MLGEFFLDVNACCCNFLLRNVYFLVQIPDQRPAHLDTCYKPKTKLICFRPRRRTRTSTRCFNWRGAAFFDDSYSVNFNQEENTEVACCPCWGYSGRIGYHVGEERSENLHWTADVCSVSWIEVLPQFFTTFVLVAYKARGMPLQPRGISMSRMAKL